MIHLLWRLWHIDRYTEFRALLFSKMLPSFWSAIKRLTCTPSGIGPWSLERNTSIFIITFFFMTVCWMELLIALQKCILIHVMCFQPYQKIISTNVDVCNCNHCDYEDTLTGSFIEAHWSKHQLLLTGTCYMQLPLWSITIAFNFPHNNIYELDIIFSDDINICWCNKCKAIKTNEID